MTTTRGRWPALRTARVTAVAALSELMDVVAPQVCAHCGCAAGPLCPACSAALNRAQRQRYAGVRPSPAPPGWPEASAWGRYTPPLSTLLHAYKDLDRRDLGQVLSPLLGEVLTDVLGGSRWDAGVVGTGGVGTRVVGTRVVEADVGDASVVEAGVGDTGIVETDALGGADRRSGGDPGVAPRHLVVPIPSSRAARRARGDRPLEALVEAALDTLPESVRPRVVHAPRLLLHTRRIADQAGLNQAERAANLAGAITVDPRARGLLRGASCLLVDDIVTTGATAMTAVKALLDGGAAQVHIVAIAAVERTSVRGRDVRAGSA